MITAILTGIITGYLVWDLMHTREKKLKERHAAEVAELHAIVEDKEAKLMSLLAAIKAAKEGKIPVYTEEVFPFNTPLD